MYAYLNVSFNVQELSSGLNAFANRFQIVHFISIRVDYLTLLEIKLLCIASYDKIWFCDDRLCL